MPDTVHSPPAVEIAIRSDPGRDPEKQVNEDVASQAETRFGLLTVVCDGMGGHAGGKEAAELALSTIIECVRSATEDTGAREALRVAIEEANRRVWSMPTAESGLRPGSTVVALLLHAGGAEVAHVGDSRAYLVHAGAISQITKDHSMVQEMVDRNLIRAEDAATHPDANKIMRALGIAKDVDVDVRAEPIAFVAGDIFILCSDGLSDLVGAAEILQIAGSHPPVQAAAQLVDFANARGGHDNVTALVARMKTSAVTSTDSKATLVKTVQVTQATSPIAGGAPPEKASGPRGTVIAGPAPSAHLPASAPMPVHPPAIAMPHAPTATLPPASRAESRSKLPLVLAIVAGLLAVSIAGLLVWWAHRPQHVNVPVIDQRDAGSSAAATPHDDDGGAPVITPAPPLLPEPAVCAKARAARERNSPAAARLEASCRAQGGFLPPLPSGSPSSSAAAAPTPTPPPPTNATAPPTTPPIPTTEPIVCAEARAARAAGAANASLLEQQCRASGGTP